MARTVEQIKAEMISDILALRDDIKIVEGDVQHDVVIAAPANQVYRLEVMQEFETRTTNLDDFESLIADDGFKTQMIEALGLKQDGTPYTAQDIDDLISERLTKYVQDFNVVRSEGTYATGFVTVYLSDASPMSWDTETEFTSKSGATYRATTSGSSVIPSFNTTKGLYYTVIPVQATDAGESSNATAGSVRDISPKPTNFSYCANETTLTGGSAIEGDLDLIERAREAWANRTNGSVGALERLAEAQSYVNDVLALAEDVPAEEIYLGSVCDLHTQFKSEDAQLVEHIFYWPGDASNSQREQFDFVLPSQPVIDTVDPVLFRYTILGVEEQVTPDPNGVDPVISIVKDTNTYAGSVKAVDLLRITMTHNTANYQRKLKVLYVYDKRPYTLQAVIDDVNNRMVGPQALVRKAVPVPFRIIVEPVISFGYDAEVVKASVEANLQIFFDGGTTSYNKQFARKRLAEDIQHSDVGTVILRTPGIASYDTDTFRVINTFTGSVSDPSDLKSNEYAVLLDVQWVFSTFNLSNFTASSA